MAGNPPKRKVSRSNTRSRRAQWKAEAPALVKTVENGKGINLKHSSSNFHRNLVRKDFVLDALC